MKGSLHPGKRILAMVLCLVSLCFLAHPVAAAQADSGNVPAAASAKEMTYTTAVHLYNYSASPVIGQLENGTKVTVLGASNGFYKVDLYDMTGYIAKEQVSQNGAGEYYIRCQEDFADTQLLVYKTIADALTMRHSILALADSLLGVPYVYGGTRPSGFDCSGFTYYLYNRTGSDLSRLATVQLKNSVIVAKESMMVGDLVFFRQPGETAILSHVGIYAGNNQIIHAGTRGICYADLDAAWFASTFLCARRVINTAPVQIQELPAPSATADDCVVRSVSGRTAH